MIVEPNPRDYLEARPEKATVWSRELKGRQRRYHAARVSTWVMTVVAGTLVPVIILAAVMYLSTR